MCVVHCCCYFFLFTLFEQCFMAQYWYSQITYVMMIFQHLVDTLRDSNQNKYDACVIEQFVLLATRLFMTSCIYSFSFSPFVNRLVLSADSFTCQHSVFFLLVLSLFFRYLHRLLCYGKVWFIWSSDDEMKIKSVCVFIWKAIQYRIGAFQRHFISIEIMALNQNDIFSIAFCVW